MTDNVIPLRVAAAGSWLCTVSLYRAADGTVRAEVAQMDPALIETTGGEVPERVRIIAEWLRAGAADLDKQAVELE